MFDGTGSRETRNEQPPQTTDPNAVARLRCVERPRMADEKAAPDSASGGESEWLRALFAPGTRRVGFGTGRVFRAISNVAPLALDLLVDSDRSKWGREIGATVVRPVDAIANENAERTIVILYTRSPEVQAARVAALGAYSTLHARSLLQLPALLCASRDAPVSEARSTIADEALVALERRYLWRILSIASDTPFAVYGAGDLGRVVLALCRQLGREPVVFFDDLCLDDAVEGVPVRRPEAALSQFAPELVLDARSGPPSGPEPGGSEHQILQWMARRAWADWRTRCEELACDGYGSPDAFVRWSEGHRRLYRRFAMIPSLGLPEESVGSLTQIVRPERESKAPVSEPSHEPETYARAIEAHRMDEEDGPFAKLFHSRHVAIVGPSEHLLDAQAGPEFDAADCVVRLNTTLEHLPISPSLAPHVGARTDVLYLAIGYASKLIAYRRALLERVLDNAWLRGIVCLDTVLTVGVLGAKSVAAFGSFCELVEQRRPDLAFHVETRTPRLIVPWLDGSSPRMGFAAITDLLSYRPRRVDVAGFTFYHGGGHLFRGEVTGVLDPTLSNDGRICTHDSRRELACLRAYAGAPSLPLQFDGTLSRLLADTPCRNDSPKSGTTNQAPIHGPVG